MSGINTNEQPNIFEGMNLKHDMTVDDIFRGEPSLWDINFPDEPLAPASQGTLDNQRTPEPRNRPTTPEPLDEAARELIILP